MTCAVSGLPIECGDEVRYLLLTKSPYSDSISCYIHDLWFPRGYPLRAVYNDYGSVEEIKSEALQQTWLDALKLDVIERGWGNNSCHDIDVHKEMDFGHLLAAIWEGRVHVSQDVPIFPELGKNAIPSLTTHKQKLIEGVPTLENIKELALQGGFTPFDGNHSKTTVMVDDDQGYGRIRVRYGTFGDGSEPLAKLESLAKAAGYAAMVTRGTGSYANQAELLIRPNSKISKYHFSNDLSDKNLLVGQVMIREDIWQALITLETEDWLGKTVKLEAYRNSAEKIWDKLSGASNFSALDRITLRHSKEPYSRVFCDDVVPFTVGLATAFRVTSLKREELSEEDKTYFLDSAAELAFIQSILANTRYQWRPSFSNGPQFGAWQQHANLLNAFKNVADKKVLEYAEEDDG